MDGGPWHCTGGRDQDHPQGKEMKNGKMVVWGGLTNSCEKKKIKRQRRKERYTHLNAEYQSIARRDKKVFLSDQCKEIQENRMGKTRDLFKKIRDTKGTFHGKMGSIKDRNGMDFQLSVTNFCFFFLGMVLIPVSCTMWQTSIHSSSATLSIRPNPLNLFLTSTV